MQDPNPDIITLASLRRCIATAKEKLGWTEFSLHAATSAVAPEVRALMGPDGVVEVDGERVAINFHSAPGAHPLIPDRAPDAFFLHPDQSGLGDGEVRIVERWNLGSERG